MWAAEARLQIKTDSQSAFNNAAKSLAKKIANLLEDAGFYKVETPAAAEPRNTPAAE